MTWTGLCPNCGHDRGDHQGAAAGPQADPDAELLLRCTQCTCVVNDAGRPWPAVAEERMPEG